jgi:radical SAM superfamily enzyme YgiQ (UPF0313 family)
MRRLPLLGEPVVTRDVPVTAARPVVALVGAEYEENLSLRYLAAAVERAGLAAVLLPFDTDDQREAIAREIVAIGAIVVGISVPFQLRAGEMLGLSRDLRALGFRGHICAGGHFATFEYEKILADFPIDSIARHEGEATFAELCALVRDGQPVPAIPGLVIREEDEIIVGEKRALPKLDALPFPDRRGRPQDVLGIRVAPLVGSRGCYADCSFCCIYAYAENAAGARYRMRSPAQIVAEMKRDYHERGVRLFVFHDDNFFLPYLPSNLTRYRQFADELRAAGLDDIGIVLKCRPNDVDRELFALLKELGCIRIYIGVETNSDEGIVSLNRRITSDDNERALAILRDLDLYHSYNVLLFDPEATLDGIERNIDFMAAHADVPFNFCRAEVYAGTPLKEILERDGRLTGDYLGWGYEMRSPRVELLFRIALTAFHGRNFRHDGVANLNNGFRFDVEVFRRFYPSLWTPDFHRRAVDFSRAVGADDITHLRRALGFVSSCDLGDRVGIKRFTLELAREVSRGDLDFLRQVKALRREMEAAITSHAKDFGARFSAGMPPWSAESARLGSSVGREISVEKLPAPVLR